MKKIYVLTLVAMMLSFTKIERSLASVDLVVDPNIVTVSSGTIDWKADSTGIRYRLIIVLSEVYLTAYIQEIHYGEETCCAHVMRTFKIKELELFEGNIFKISDVVWLKNDSVKLKANDLSFLLTNLSGNYECVKLDNGKGKGP
jgi:hypothetical protein